LDGKIEKLVDMRLNSVGDRTGRSWRPESDQEPHFWRGTILVRISYQVSITVLSMPVVLVVSAADLIAT
jgi:hypothetical protein